MGRERESSASYALDVAVTSYAWYKKASMRARRYFRLTEILTVLFSAAIPLVAAIDPGDARVPAILGGILVVISGLRAVFRWSDDYLRFSRAREEVDGEIRLYKIGARPYDDIDMRDALLVENVIQIEKREMGDWVSIFNSQKMIANQNESG
jgi:hypothetical protein